MAPRMEMGAQAAAQAKPRASARSYSQACPRSKFHRLHTGSTVARLTSFKSIRISHNRVYQIISHLQSHNLLRYKNVRPISVCKFNVKCAFACLSWGSNNLH